MGDKCEQTKRSTAVVRTVTASVTVWLREQPCFSHDDYYIAFFLDSELVLYCLRAVLLLGSGLILYCLRAVILLRSGLVSYCLPATHFLGSG